MTDKDIQTIRVVPDGPILVRGPVRIELPDDTDSGAVEAGYIAVTALSRMLDDSEVKLAGLPAALDQLT